MRRFFLATFLLFFSLEAFAVSETQIKAVFLEKFTHLIEWPKQEEKHAFSICVLNNEEFAEALKQIYKDKLVKSKPVKIMSLSHKEKIPTCDLMFIGAKTKNVNEIITKLSKTQSTLTVSDSKEYLESDVMITMFLNNSRFRYIINKGAAKKADIKISYLLLKSAQEVIDE